MSSTTSKIAERQHYGEEPTWSSNEANDALYCRALNWYHHMSEEDDHVKWLLAYLKESSRPQNEIKAVAATKRGSLFWGEIGANDLGINLGVHARILSLGGWIPQKTLERFNLGIKRLVLMGTSMQEVKVEVREDQPTVGIQERISEQVRRMIGHLEMVEDCLIRNETPVYPCACAGADAEEGHVCETCGGTKKTDSNLNDWISRRVKGVHANRIAEWFRRRLSEIESVLEGTADDQLIEGYSLFTKKNLKTRRDWLNQVVEACEHQKAVAKKMRTPRRKRQKAPIEIVKNLKFKSIDGEYKTKSILPSKIVGAEKLVTFNTVTRVCSIFEADSRLGLSVKGTTIIGFDPKKSVCKVLRKPEELIGVVAKNGGIRAIKNAFNASKTVEKEPTGRINDDTILLGVY